MQISGTAIRMGSREWGMLMPALTDSRPSVRPIHPPAGAVTTNLCSTLEFGIFSYSFDRITELI